MKLQLETTGINEMRDVVSDAPKPEKVEKRPMDYVEKILLQNQQALSATVSDMEQRYAKSLNEFLMSNADTLNKMNAITMQIQSIQVRLANLQGHGRTEIQSGAPVGS